MGEVGKWEWIFEWEWEWIFEKPIASIRGGDGGGRKTNSINKLTIRMLNSCLRYSMIEDT